MTLPVPRGEHTGSLLELDYAAYPLLVDADFTAHWKALGVDTDVMLRGADGRPHDRAGLPDHVRVRCTCAAATGAACG
jgi:hypothetical protein